LRHFQPIFCPEIKDVSVDRIFTGFTDTHFTTNNSTVAKLLHIIPRATMAVYRSASNTLLPVSTKIHYIFHIRDVFKVLKGIIFGLGQQANINISQLMRLWFHECLRVFGDKINLKEDKQWLGDLLTGTMKTFFEYTSLSLTGDILMGQLTREANYDEIYDVEKFAFNMKLCLNEYNSQNTRKPLDIYLFKEAVISLAKISRIIARPNNSALVLGKLGVGKSSLTKLAAFIINWDVYEVCISKTYSIQEWQEDIKKLLRLTGLQNKNMLFLVTENQLVHPRFMEDIANLIHSGTIPDLFLEEEIESIAQTVQATMKSPLPIQEASSVSSNTHQASMEFFYNKFISQVRNNLRVTLCLDPESAHFKEYLRNYPSMIYSCTMVYVDDWTQESLKAVAKHQLSTSSLETSQVEKVASSLVSLQEIVAQV
jgi:dynein heavy chain